MEQKILEIIADYQGKDVSAYTEDQTFTSMGLDSLDLAELIIQMEDSLGITVELSPKLNTPAKLAEYINSIQ